MDAELYSIGEVAEMTGVPIKTIRYYADIGLLPPAATTEARYRLYSPAEIWRLELVRTLRHVGFGLDEIQRVLAGDVDIATAIGWQVEALDAQIGNLTRLRDLLRQARAATDDERRSLAFLHDIGQAVTRDSEERSRFLAEKLGPLVGREDMPPEWNAGWLETMRRRLPADPTPEQAAAWAELVALLDDPEFVAASRAHAAPFWQIMRERQVDGAWWHTGMAKVNAHAQAALLAGAGPDSEEVQAIARDWAALFARAMGVPCDDAFLERFAEQAPHFMDERSRRIHELLERAGWTDGGPSQLAVQQLVLDGLLALVRHSARRDSHRTS